MTQPTDANTAAPRPPALNARDRHRLAVQGVTFVAVLGAFAWGFDAGMKIAGPMIGVAMALNMAFFAGLLCGWIADRLLGPKSPKAR